MRSFDAQAAQPWARSIESVQVVWLEGKTPKFETPLRIDSTSESRDFVMSADYERLGVLSLPLNPDRAELLVVTASEVRKTIVLDYVGLDKLWAE